jgi:cation:H+ antiporter
VFIEVVCVCDVTFDVHCTASHHESYAVKGKKLSRSSGPFWILIAALTCIPAVTLRLSHTHLGVVTETVLFGAAIVGAAFLLSWTAEAAEVDIAQGLAVAAVALIAVLPEYAVDLALAWRAGEDPSYAPYAVANMTGANRLLVGGAWPLIFLIFWWRSRKSLLVLDRPQAFEVLTLLVATVYSFTIPLKGSISLIDTVVLGAIFLVYVWVVGRTHAEEPVLVGPARFLGSLPNVQRRLVLFGLFVFSAGAVFAAAEPFAEGLIHTGTDLGLDEFLLVQWVAPFASEAPEFLIAAILAYRLRAATAMRVLLSSKVNQWTLLIGGLAVAYGASQGGWQGLPLDGRQREELWLTAAQSLFAVTVLSSLSFSGREATVLFALFAVQFVVPTPEVRLAVTFVYVVAALAIVAARLGDIRALWRTGIASIRHPQGPHDDSPVRLAVDREEAAS